MALPLLWLGAAALSALTAKELSDDRKKQQRQRKRSYKPQTLEELKQHDSPVATYPTEFFDTNEQVKPQIGAIVCCGIGGVLDHTGIWVGDNTIVELDGEGLVKPVSPKRFTHNRTGEKIFIACDSLAKPLVNKAAAERACEMLFQYQEYDVIDNNCHQFIWQCFNSSDRPLTTFKSLNMRLAKYFNRRVFWDQCRYQY